MRKPLNYYGVAFDKPEDDYRKAYLKTKEGKKDIKRQKNRNKKLKKQLKRRGFDDSEVWSLSTTVVKFLLPRLKSFRKNPKGYPSQFKNVKQWKNILDSMIYGLEYELDHNTKDRTKARKGVENLGKHFYDLWD